MAVTAKSTRHVAEHHFDFGGVAVIARFEGADRAGTNRMVRPGVGFCAAFGRADFEFGGGALDHTGAGERQQREVDRRRVAADAAGVVRAAQLLARDFGQPVDEAIQPLRGGMGFAVPAGVSFG